MKNFVPPANRVGAVHHDGSRAPRRPDQQQYVEAIKQLQQQNAELAKRGEAMRRIVWLCIHRNHGRIEISGDEYRMAMQMSPNDFAFNVQPVDGGKTVAFVECEQDGKEVSQIILPPGTKL